MRADNPYPIERILSAATYLTVGWAGAIWLIIAAVLRKKVTKFLMYHILQSIFLTLLYVVIQIIMFCIGNIIGHIPIIKNIPLLINMPIPIAFNLSLIQVFTTSIILYLTITSYMGYYSYLPWVSDVIKGNTRN